MKISQSSSWDCQPERCCAPKAVGCTDHGGSGKRSQHWPVSEQKTKFQHPPMGDAQLTAATGGSSDMLRAEIARPSISSSISNQNSQVLAVSAKLSWTISEVRISFYVHLIKQTSDFQFERLTRLVKNGKSLVSERFYSSSAPHVVWELHVGRKSC